MLDMESLLFGAKNMERERESALAIAMRTPDRDSRRCGNGWTLDQQACNISCRSEAPRLPRLLRSLEKGKRI